MAAIAAAPCCSQPHFSRESRLVWRPVLAPLLLLLLLLLLLPPASQAGKFIVFLDPSVQHDAFERSIHGYNGMLPYTHVSYNLHVSHRFTELAHAVAVSGSNLQEQHLQGLHGVVHVAPDRLRRLPGRSAGSAGRRPRRLTATAGPPWGVDILDSGGVADGKYDPAYSGAGVDVYVVDSGIDALHAEFRPRAGHPRVVRNIYDEYAAVRSRPSANPDDVGHGTHVAGTIGGSNVGVARDANLLGVKVLDSKGETDDSIILRALEFVAARAKTSAAAPHGSVLSMSLGGACSTADCAKDALNIFVEKLSAAGVLVSVASGNEGCNACFGAPNGAASAFVVGSLSQAAAGLEQSSFSNFGQCIDVLAAGGDVLSACSSRSDGCQGDDLYVEESGTSMAAPHVTGVLAQLLQKKPNAALADLYDAMACDSTKDAVQMLPSDTITRNMILQTPKMGVATYGDYCHLGGTCSSACSGHGVCLRGETAAGNLGAISTCFCDPNYWGSGCASPTDQACQNKHYPLQMQMQDAYGDGWSLAKFSIVDRTSLQVVDDAYDSLCDGNGDVRDYCMPPDQCYTLRVSRGEQPQENSWTACGMNGGSPARVEFCVRGDKCVPSCAEGAVVLLGLTDRGEDGWGGGYYGAYATSGAQIAGGTLQKEQGAHDLHTLCVPDECAVAMIELDGDAPEDISIEACGMTATAAQLLKICPSKTAAAGCVATVLPQAAAEQTSACGAGELEVQLAYIALDTPSPPSYSIGPFHGTLKNFTEQLSMCVADGCHPLTLTNTSISGASWYMCGQRGAVPWNAQVCVESAAGLCYGLTGCSQVRSYVHHSSAQWFFLSDSERGSSDYLQVFNAHGVHELCGVNEGTVYKFDFGFGRHNVVGSDSDTWEMCGQTGSFPASGTVVFNGGLSCHVTSLVSEVCVAGTVSLLMAKLDTYGDGWGTARNTGYFSIRRSDTPGDISGTLVAKGGLSSGSYGVEALCLSVGQCYVLTVEGSVDVEEMYAFMCGAMVPGAAASAHPVGLRFCVEGAGACVFDENEKDRLADDDFLPTAGAGQQGSTGADPAVKPEQPAAGQQAVLVSAYMCRMTVFTDKDRFIDSRDMKFLAHALHHTVSAAQVFPVWAVTVNGVLDEIAPVSNNPGAGASTSITVRRRLGRDYDLFETTVMCTVSVSLLLTAGAAAEDAQAALRFLVLEAGASGTLQRDIDRVMQALESMTESDDDGAEQAAGIDPPTRAKLLSLVPDPSTAASKPAVVYYGEGVLPPPSATYTKIWREEVVLEDQAAEDLEFPLALLLLLTTIATSMLLLYLHYLCQRYNPKGPVGLLVPDTGGAGAGYRSVSLTGSSHSIVHGDGEDDDSSSPRSTDSSRSSSNPLHSSGSGSRGKKKKKKAEGEVASAPGPTRGRGIEMRQLVRTDDADEMEEEVMFAAADDRL